MGWSSKVWFLYCSLAAFHHRGPMSNPTSSEPIYCKQMGSKILHSFDLPQTADLWAQRLCTWYHTEKAFHAESKSLRAGTIDTILAVPWPVEICPGNGQSNSCLSFPQSSIPSVGVQNQKHCWKQVAALQSNSEVPSVRLEYKFPQTGVRHLLEDTSSWSVWLLTTASMFSSWRTPPCISVHSSVTQHR